MFAFKKEEIIKLREGLSRKLFWRRKIWLGAGVLLGLVLVVSLIISYNKPNAYGVMLNGQQIAAIENKAILEQALRAVQPDFANVRHVEKLELKEVKTNPKELFGAKEIRTLLAGKLTWVVKGAVISLNGKEIACVESEKVAEQVLEEVKQVYLPKNVDKLQSVEVSFEDQIAIQAKEISSQQIISATEAQSLLLGTEEAAESYTVAEGDNLWTIARANDMRVADIMLANSEITSEEDISIGQVIKLNKSEPIISVTTTYKQQVAEKIAFDTKTIEDKSLARGQNKVKQPGQEGEKQVEYQFVLRNGSQIAKDKVSEKVIKEPVQKVVLRGTKLVLAARSSGGSGQLAWPLRGGITSSYGYRGREFHTGMDINGNTGNPVRAAESGKVTQAGWAGGYGYMVTINHGGGLVTRYAHNSKLKVKVGDKVSRGETIALVGSTGRSTGSHLHFEVLVNGSFKNPRSYLK